MPVSVASRVFALLAVAALVAALLLVVLGRRSAAAAVVAEARLWLAWLVATVSTAGSLFYSEVAGFAPCVLCWYQRIGMYPLVIILGVAAWRNDPGGRPYALPLAVGGGLVSAYHYLLQWVPALGAGACRPDNPCTLRWVWELGFVSIPLMALAGFTLIIVLLTLPIREARP